MIHATLRGEATWLSTTLPAGCTAFIDADWLPRRDGAVLAIVARPEGKIAYADGPAFQLPAHVPAERIAAGALAAVAAAAATAANACGTPTGRGVVALDVRKRLVSVSNETRIETTGQSERIAAAAAALPELGKLILAAGAEEIDLDLYPDAHARGLTLIGIDPPFAADSQTLTDEPPALYAETLADVSPGSPLPPGPAWYRLSI